jgi:glycosyltransferase involved in cell wall biosynthesis
LVEALGAGNAVIAHDNEFNRWTVGPDQMFFKDIGQCTDAIAKLWQDDLLTKRAQMAARARFSERFRWDDILAHYRSLMLDATGIQVAAE